MTKQEILDYFEDIDFMYNHAGMHDDLSKMLDKLLEQSKQKFFVDSDGKITPLPIHPQWTSVKDRLPDDASDVLAYYDCGDDSRVMFVNYYKRCWYDSVFNDLIDDLDQGCITHWMPLPEPPEGVKQDD